MRGLGAVGEMHRQRRCPTCGFWVVWEPVAADNEEEGSCG